MILAIDIDAHVSTALLYKQSDGDGTKQRAQIILVRDEAAATNARTFGTCADAQPWVQSVWNQRLPALPGIYVGWALVALRPRSYQFLGALAELLLEDGSSARSIESEIT